MKGGRTILNIGSLDPNHMSPFFRGMILLLVIGGRDYIIP